MTISQAKDFEETPRGWAQRWEAELASAKEMIEPYQKKGIKVVEKFLDKRGQTDESMSVTRVNLFHANITTIRSMLYGRMPRVEVDRRHADPDDDVARVASEILERMLNIDIETASDDFSSVLRYALEDRLLPGFGIARVRYSAKIEEVEVPGLIDPITGEEQAPGYTEERVAEEEAGIDYVHWKDTLWSYGRTWSELRWFAFRSYMNKDDATTRFGEDKAKKLEYKVMTPDGPKTDSSSDEKDSWMKAEVWEIWCSENKKVYWHSLGCDELLDSQDDIYGLREFYPAPQPMVANLTTNLFLPTPDYIISQDLYREVDELENRISILTEAVRLAGVYDKQFGNLQRLVTEAGSNELIPVDSWAAFAEKGGFKGVMEWLPIEEVVNCIQTLTQVRDSKVNFLYQVTGMADVLRGASVAGASATEQAIKARFASVRIQALQDEFARFASDLMRLKAEIICKLFQPQTILEKSNIMLTPDRDLAMKAIEFLKSDKQDLTTRIVVRPESVAMVDYAQLKQERSEYITALATFLQSAVPMMQLAPGAAPMLLELLKWGLAGFKGSSQIEGVVDRAIEGFKQNPPQDPNKGAEAQKQQIEMQKMQMDIQRSQQEHQFKMQEMMIKHNQALIEMAEKFKIELATLREQTSATVTKEAAQSVFALEKKDV